MANIYCFADESGDLGFDSENGSKHFGFGTATFTELHNLALWESFDLRCKLEVENIQIRSGFHATNDSWATKKKVYELIFRQKPRFDFTFLDKHKLTTSVKANGQIYLYKLAWYLHFKEVALRISSPGDTIYAISATIHTNAKTTRIKNALNDVANQVPNRKIVPIYWDASTSWGLQVADYGLWLAHRHLLQLRTHNWWTDSIEPLTRTFFLPFR